jgi:hypothetical protein
LAESALRLSRTFTVTFPARLAPFALWTAFPPSDYYGARVALGVAPCRRSRVPHAFDEQDGLGALFASLFRPLTRPSPPRVLPLLPSSGRVIKGATGPDPPCPACCITVWTLGLGQSSFRRAIRAKPGLPLGGLTTARLCRHATFPSRFPLQVGLAAQGQSTQSLPCLTGIKRAVTRRPWHAVSQRQQRSQAASGRRWRTACQVPRRWPCRRMAGSQRLWWGQPRRLERGLDFVGRAAGVPRREG